MDENVASPRSGLYYSLRRLSREKRATVVAIFAFYREIEDITLNYEEITIAHIKLNWWRDEVIKIKDAEPSHPIARDLKHTLGSINPLRLIELIDGLEQNLALPQFERFEDVMIHFMRTAGARELLIADVLQKDSVISADIIYQLAFVIEFVHYLQHLHRYVKRGLIYFSQDELAKFDVIDVMFHQYKTTPNIRNLLECQAEKVNRFFQKASSDLSDNSRSQLANIIIRCQMAMAILKEIQASDFKVLENFINITPLRYWWIAWRF